MPYLKMSFWVLVLVSGLVQPGPARADLVLRLGHPQDASVSEELAGFLADALSARLEEQVYVVPAEPADVLALFVALDAGVLDIAWFDGGALNPDLISNIDVVRNDRVFVWIMSPSLDPVVTAEFRAVLAEDLQYYLEEPPLPDEPTVIEARRGSQ